MFAGPLPLGRFAPFWWGAYISLATKSLWHLWQVSWKSKKVLRYSKFVRQTGHEVQKVRWLGGAFAWVGCFWCLVENCDFGSGILVCTLALRRISWAILFCLSDRTPNASPISLNAASAPANLFLSGCRSRASFRYCRLIRLSSASCSTCDQQIKQVRSENSNSLPKHKLSNHCFQTKYNTRIIQHKRYSKWGNICTAIQYFSWWNQHNMVVLVPARLQFLELLRCYSKKRSPLVMLVQIQS